MAEGAPLRHGCSLALRVVLISAVVLVVVGLFGLVGPREVLGIVVLVALGVLVVDRVRSRRSS